MVDAPSVLRTDSLPSVVAVGFGSAKWHLSRLRSRAHRPISDHSFTRAKFELAVDESKLKPAVKRTLRVTADFADDWGRTTVERKTVADLCRINVKTVTEHWRKASEARLIAGRRRFNSSKVQQLVLPGSIEPVDLTSCRMLAAHQWSDAEVDWWNHLDLRRVLFLPWADGISPF